MKRTSSKGQIHEVKIFTDLEILRNLDRNLSYVVPVKSTMEILQNYVAFSEYMNFTAHATSPLVTSI